jgi:hypothetical protein
MFEISVLRGIFGGVRGESERRTENIFYEELHDFICRHPLHQILHIRMIKSIRMRCTGHVAHIREITNA